MLEVDKIDKIRGFLLIIFHFTNGFVIYLYPCTEIDVESFKYVSPDIDIKSFKYVSPD